MANERDRQDLSGTGSTGSSGLGASGSTTGGSSGLGASGAGSSGMGGSSLGGSGLGSTGSGLGSTGSTGDAGTRAGSFDRKFTDESTGSDIKDKVGDKIEEGRERMHEAVDAGRERAGEAVESGKNRIAGQLETLGDRLEERARTMEDAGGVQRRAGQAAMRASEALDSSADYLRSHDPAEMRDDLERAIRERPLFSVGMAVGAGFLLARLMRD
jgi:ElaB/YqjD/DUF883 family membrane-anchored ribosome-binding protein